LFDQVFKIFLGFLKKDITIFATELKPYIISQRLKGIIIPGEVVSNLVTFYHKKDE
jgi:hypothetical protein